MALVDYFLKLDGIQGEATGKGHEKEIDIESFSWGATNTALSHIGGGGGQGKVNVHDLSVTKKTDKASTSLFLNCCNGAHIKEGTLTARKAGGDQQEYFKIKLSDILVSSYQVSGHNSADVIPQESITLNFAKVQITYSPQKADGTLDSAVNSGWDLKSNVKV
jgi:type VI secretion system secreted protein Hcp